MTKWYAIWGSGREKLYKGYLKKVWTLVINDESIVVH